MERNHEWFFYKVEGFLERKLRLKSLIAVTVVACGGLQASHAAADVYCYADSVSTLQACLTAAQNDEANWHEIQLKEKTYYLSSPLTLTKGKVRLVGAGRVLHDTNTGIAGLQYSADVESASARKALNRAKFFVLDGQNQTRIFNAAGVFGGLNLYIQGITFQNGNPTTDNKGGGGLWFKGEKLAIDHSIFTGNSDSAVWHEANDMQGIENSYFYNNTAEYPTPDKCPPFNGTSEYWGGAITAHGSDYEIKRSTFENNRGCRGGAIYTEAETELVDSTVSNNTAALGGGVYIADGSSGAAGMEGSTIFNNHASIREGGLYFEQQTSTEWGFFNGNIVAGNSAFESMFSDCFLKDEPLSSHDFTRGPPEYIKDNILGDIGVGEPEGDCTYWLNSYDNQPTGVPDPELESLAYNGSIGLQLKTHLPKASSISLDVVDSSEGKCSDQRAGGNAVASSPQNRCAAGATQRIQLAGGTWGDGESRWPYLNLYKMVLAEGRNIQIDLVSDEADARLILRDANHSIIESNDDYSSGSSNARITRQLGAGVYYIFAWHDNNADHSILRDYFLSVNAEVELTPSLVYKDNAEIDKPTMKQMGTVLWKRTDVPLPSGTSYYGDYYYKMDSTSAQSDDAIFVSDYFDPADTKLNFKYLINGANSGALYLDIDYDDWWDYSYWARSGTNSNHISPDWQTGSYNFNWLSLQGYDKIRIRLYGYQYWTQDPYSGDYLLLDDILIDRYDAWNN